MVEMLIQSDMKFFSKGMPLAEGDKFEDDELWDGLKGYITNTSLSGKEVIENYGNLWQIEKAFRISKTDLQIRPILS